MCKDIIFKSIFIYIYMFIYIHIFDHIKLYHELNLLLRYTDEIQIGADATAKAQNPEASQHSHDVRSV